MEILLQILTIVIFIGVGLFLRSFLPSYFDEKAKNLATKEDIGDITDEIEKVKFNYSKEVEQLKTELNKDFQEYIDEQKFLKERSYNQYCELYSKLYTIIVQSEYLRYFNQFDDNFDNLPFLETSREKIKTNIDLKTMSVKQTREEINDAVTNFNKISIVDMVIDKGHLASERLIKLAVAYRYVHEFYTDETMDPEQLEKFQKEELVMIAEIVKTVIYETNKFKKICSLDYNENEIKDRTMCWESIYKRA
jgi:hypothetical protein